MPAITMTSGGASDGTQARRRRKQVQAQGRAKRRKWDEFCRRIVWRQAKTAESRPAADKGANPEVVVRDRDAVFWARAEVLKGEERNAAWARLVVDRPFYDDYQARTQRTIPLVRLVESRPYEG